MPPRAPLAAHPSLRKSYPLTCVRHSTLDFQTGKQPKVLSLFRRIARFFGRNNAVMPFGGGEARLSASPMETPSAYKLMPFGFASAGSEFTNSGALRPTDTKPLIVNSNRTTSRQYCLPWNAGIDPRTGALAPVTSKTRGVNDAILARRMKSRADLRHVPAVSAVGPGECVQAHQHKLLFSNLTLCNRRI